MCPTSRLKSAGIASSSFVSHMRQMDEWIAVCLWQANFCVLPCSCGGGGFRLGLQCFISHELQKTNKITFSDMGTLLYFAGPSTLHDVCTLPSLSLRPYSNNYPPLSSSFKALPSLPFTSAPPTPQEGKKKHPCMTPCERG